MSIRAMVWAFDQKCPSPAAKLVLIKLADHADDEGRCWPSQSRVAADCGLSRETVNRQIKALVDAGLIAAEQRINDKGQQSNLYFLRCDIPSHPPVINDHTPCDLRSHPPVTRDHTEPSLEPSEEDSVPSVRPKDPVKEIFDRGVALLGGDRRSLLGKMRRDHGDEAVLAAIVKTETERPSEPTEFFIACLSRAGPKPVNGNHPGTYRPGPGAALFEGGYLAAQAVARKLGLDQPEHQPPAVPLLDGERARRSTTGTD